ncbi:MAG: hypothetical protein KAU17_12645 [Spirochaetales bacterium]|nr:hypothetical protein [Spirochaetales bacterium]
MISKHFVKIFEKLTRAIVRQFTLGDLGKEPGKYIGFYSHFLFLTDDQIGVTDYYKKFFYKEVKDPQKYSHNNTNKRLTISRKEYDKLWPYKNTNSVTVEKSNDGCIFLIINKKVYALNGTTSQKYNFPFAHDLGEAFIGRAVGDFISIALEL